MKLTIAFSLLVVLITAIDSAPTESTEWVTNDFFTIEHFKHKRFIWQNRNTGHCDVFLEVNVDAAEMVTEEGAVETTTQKLQWVFK